MRRALWAMVVAGGLWAIVAAIGGGGSTGPAADGAAAPDATAVDASDGPAGTSTPPTPPPVARPLSPAQHARLDEAARSLPLLRSLLVSLRGELLFEQYYNGAGPDRLANIKSASKSVISALVGIAVDRGLIPDVRTPIVRYFPELTRDPDPRKRRITVENLLTMRPGLEGTSNRNYGAWVTSRDWVRFALARPMFAAPGEAMEYSTGNTHLLSAILTETTGESTWAFANEALAEPLGFSLPRWPRDPQGIYFGGNDMLMTPRQMVTFGELYLHGGRAGGRQIVSPAWVRRSCEGIERSRRPGPAVDRDGNVDPLRDRRYGYGWWVDELDGYDTCFAWGYGGQYVFVLPDLDLVLVATSSSEVNDERRGHRRTLIGILEELVVAPMMAPA